MVVLLGAACSAGGGDPTFASPVQSFVDDYSAASGYDQIVSGTVNECMAAAGFDYDYEAVRSSGSGPRSETAPGFGISTGYRSPGEFLTDPLRFVSAAEVDYFEALDPLQQARYLRRLYIGATGLDGCLALAFEAGFGLRPAALDRLQQAVLTLRSGYGPDSRTDPGAAADWAACMADRGFNYGAPDDLAADLVRRLDGIAGRFGESPVAALIQQDPNFRADPIPAEAFRPDYPPLLALQDYEVAAAEASADCGVDSEELRAGTDGVFPRGGPGGVSGPVVVDRDQKAAEIALLRDMETELRPLAEAVGMDFDAYLN